MQSYIIFSNLPKILMKLCFNFLKQRKNFVELCFRKLKQSSTKLKQRDRN